MPRKYKIYLSICVQAGWSGSRGPQGTQCDKVIIWLIHPGPPPSITLPSATRGNSAASDHHYQIYNNKCTLQHVPFNKVVWRVHVCTWTHSLSLCTRAIFRCLDLIPVHSLPSCLRPRPGGNTTNINDQTTSTEPRSVHQTGCLPFSVKTESYLPCQVSLSTFPHLPFKKQSYIYLFDGVVWLVLDDLFSVLVDIEWVTFKILKNIASDR